MRHAIEIEKVSGKKKKEKSLKWKFKLELIFMAQ